MLRIGCHLSTKRGYLEMAEEIASINGNTFQYFTRNPRGGAQKALDEKDVEAYKSYAADHGIARLCAYAPYDIEPANPASDKHDFAVTVLTEDAKRLEAIPGQFYLIRPGSAPDTPLDDAIDCMGRSLNTAMFEGMHSMVLIDTMAGEGSQIGYTFEQLASIIEKADMSDNIGVCLDASAVWAAGYDIVNDLDGVLDEFDEQVGLDKLKAIHLNDSKEGRGSKADRHARIGEGKIGFDALMAMVNDARLSDVCFYLEEPESTLVIYERDIARFQSGYKG